MEPEDLSGAVLDGRYRVIGPVAEGAMGVVYRAERLKLGRVVAVKVLHDSLPDELASRQRFEVEAMAMAKLEHPHCAAVLDVGVHDGRPFVVMDFVSGTDLKTVISEGRMPIPRALEILRQILSGLAHAHELGIIHRDVKPANIMLGQKTGLGDHAKILDFGLARLQQGSNTLTRGIVVGTPAYMAPEQIRGDDIDGRADLYACGIILFELLTGTKPFHSEADDPLEICGMHLNKPPPTLADKQPGEYGELEAIVARALAKSPADRFQSATEFVAALDELRMGGSRPIPRITGDVVSGAVAMQSWSLPPSEASQSAAAPARVATHPGTQLGLAVATGLAPIAGASTPAPAAPVRAPAEAGAGSAGSGAPAGGWWAKIAGASRQQLAISGGALVVIVVSVIAIIASSEDAPRASSTADGPPSSAPVEPPEIDMGATEVVARANKLIREGELGDALQLVVASRKAFPNDPQLPYIAGKLYFGKLWWSAGLKQFRDAIRLDPAFKTDPELIKVVLKGFITTPERDGDIAGFLVNDIGAAARPFLEETARDHPNKSIRARAEAELRRLR
ncbi:MAG: serine/threonine-protein kinase [Kofleriaceae bacterium]